MATPPAPAASSSSGYGKSVGAVAGGAVSTLIIGALDHYMPGFLNDTMDAALQTLIVLGCVYFTPHRLSN